MKSPKAMLYWIEIHIEPRRRSRQKTLADVVAAAMHMGGAGVLALGRAMPGRTAAKHAIKRVRRFFRNQKLEFAAVWQAMVNTLAPQNAPVVILVDWTEYGGFKTLVAALPRDSRALTSQPSLSRLESHITRDDRQRLLCVLVDLCI